MPDCQTVGFTPVRNAFFAVLADGFQQSIPRALVAVFGDDKGPGDKACDHVHGVFAVDEFTAAYLLDGLEGAASGEHRPPREEPLLSIAEKVIRPIDGRTQSRVALDRPPSCPRKHVKSAIEPRNQLGRAHRNNAGSGQLDGQSDAVKTLTGLCDRAGVAGCQGEIRLDLARSL